jgi:hypothetical protein
MRVSLTLRDVLSPAQPSGCGRALQRIRPILLRECSVAVVDHVSGESSAENFAGPRCLLVHPVLDHPLQMLDRTPRYLVQRTPPLRAVRSGVRGGLGRLERDLPEVGGCYLTAQCRDRQGCLSEGRLWLKK